MAWPLIAAEIVGGQAGDAVAISDIDPGETGWRPSSILAGRGSPDRISVVGETARRIQVGQLVTKMLTVRERSGPFCTRDVHGGGNGQCSGLRSLGVRG